uniref:Sperm-associated antigen 5 n=1 Tax=Leptobrachium leishanense TaxID=445787 RepID=A0A8C5MYZ6_9ANUR
MSSPKKNTSPKNCIPSVNTVNGKSRVRTPLQDLTGQHISSEQRITRSSAKRLSGLAASLRSQALKESSRSTQSTPVRVWNNTLPKVVLTECVGQKHSKLKPCSLSKCKFEKLNVVAPTKSLDCSSLSSHPRKNVRLTEQLSDAELIKSPEVSSPDTVRVEGGEDLTTVGLETNTHQKTIAQECCVLGSENLSHVCEGSRLMEKPCSVQKEEQTAIANASYTKGDNKAGTSEHGECYTLLSEGMLSSSFNNQPNVSTGDATCVSHPGETGPVELCPSVVDEFEVLVNADEIKAPVCNDTYVIDPSLNVSQEVVEQACLTSPSVVASIMLVEIDASMAEINEEELSLLEPTSGVLHETCDIQDLLQSDRTDLYELLTTSLPGFFPIDQRDCPGATDDNLPKDVTKDTDPTMISSILVSSFLLDQSDCPDFPAITDTAQHCLPQSINANLPSVLPSEELLGDVYIKETANNYASFIDEVPNPVSSTERPIEQPAQHNDVCTVAESRTPFLRTSQKLPGDILFSVCQTRGAVSLSPVMQLHPTALGSPMSSNGDGSRNFHSVRNSQLDCGACISPISRSSDATWITPIMLLNKSINTSPQDFNGRDNASETDSLLWNFSVDSLHDAPREEVISRLEGSLIVIQVLSRQLQEWQKDLRSSRPSEQRDSSSQTAVSYDIKDEQYYHNLYLKSLERLQSVQRTREEEEQLFQVLRLATEALESHRTQSISMTEKLHDMMQYDKVDLTDQSLKDLKIHYSRVIAKLRRDFESERKLSASVKWAYEQQLSANKELVQFTHMIQSVCEEAEDDRTRLRLQCSDTKELMSQYNRLFETMKEKTQMALQDRETLKCERDFAYSENEELYIGVNGLTSQNDQLKTETARLTSELTSLMQHICEVKSETDQLRQDNSELAEELCAKSSSLNLLEKELNEATARALEFHDRNRELNSQIVPRLKQELFEAAQQYTALTKQFQDLETQHASQMALYNESIEFLEQENYVCREQVFETESQLKANLFALRERNLQCESQKDRIAELKKEINGLQEELDSTKQKARNMLLKMGTELSVSSVEVYGIKENLKKLTESLHDTTRGEVFDASCFSTPARKMPCSDSLVGSVLKAHYGKDGTASETKNVTSIWSETSAFSVVRPLNSPTAGEEEDQLPDVLREINDSVVGFANSSSKIIETKLQIIKDLGREIFLLQEELQRKEYQYKSDIRDLKDDIHTLERKNQNLTDGLNRKQQCIRELEELAHQQEQKIMQQLRKKKEQEEIFEENASLKQSLELSENAVCLLKEEMAKNPTSAARDWIEEKLMLCKDLSKLRLMLIDTEAAKSEIVRRSIKCRDILEKNLAHSERELKKLDDLIQKIRETLLTIPDVVSSNDELIQIMESLN